MKKRTAVSRYRVNEVKQIVGPANQSFDLVIVVKKEYCTGVGHAILMKNDSKALVEFQRVTIR